MGFAFKWTTPFAKQIWTSSGVLLSNLGQGMVSGYPACLLHALRASDSPIKTSLNAASWIASVTGIANMLGCMCSSFLMDRCGRRKTFILTVVPSILGWLLIYFASDIPSLIIGRMLCGITGGATAILGAIVIGEYTSPKIRGILLNLKTTALCSGTLLVHVMGNFYDWRTVAILAVIPKVASLIIVWTWPESPAWLASKEQFDRCEKEFYWLRGNSEEATIEFEEFIQAQKERLSMSATLKKDNCCGTVKGFFKKFTRRDFVKPVLIIIVGGIMIEACGKHIFPSYAKAIVGDLTTNENYAFYITLCFDFFIIISTAVASILTKFMNRRTLLFSTGVPAFIILLLVCLYLFLASKDIVSNTVWIPFIGFLIFFIFSNMGCTLIPLVLLGEIFPLAHKGVGTVVVGIIVSSCLVIVVKVTPYLLVTIKIYGTFAVFGLVLGVSLLVLYFLQPETKDRTLQQIEDYFNYGEYRDYRVRKNKEATVKIID